MRKRDGNVLNEQGMTLVEVLAATIILGIVVTAFMHLSGFSLLARQMSQTEAEALRLAEEQLHLAREAIASGQPLPVSPTTVKGYTVVYHLSDYGTAPDSDAAGLPASASKVSMQAVVFHAGLPRMLTVTVAWDGEAG